MMLHDLINEIETQAGVKLEKISNVRVDVRNAAGDYNPVCEESIVIRFSLGEGYWVLRLDS